MVEMDIETQQDKNTKRKSVLWNLYDGLIAPGGGPGIHEVTSLFRKRPSPLKGLTVPDPQQIALWSPLILHIYSRYPIFSSILLSAR